MNIIIQSLQFTANEDLTDFVNQKVNSLEQFYDRIESAKVVLKLENSDTTENRICEIRLAVPGNDLFAKRQCKTFEEATAEVVDALEQQIKKMKSKLDNR